MRKGQIPPNLPLRRVNFVVERVGAGWRVLRNGRLVMIFDERRDAMKAVEGYANAVRGKGDEAHVWVRG